MVYIGDLKGTSLEIDGKKVVDSQQNAIDSLIDNTGGIDAGAGSTLSEITEIANVGSADLQLTRNAISTLSGQIERILVALRLHGLIEE